METAREFKRELQLLDSTMIVIGPMIGSGIFIVGADIVRTVGGPGWILMSWQVAGLFILRRTRPGAERPYRAFGYPVVPALYVLAAAAIAVDLLILKPAYTWPGLGIVLLGVPVYFGWTRMRRRAAA